MMTDGNYTYCDGHWGMYRIIESVCGTLETNIRLYVNCTLIKKKRCWFSWKSSMDSRGKAEIRRSRKLLLPSGAHRSSGSRRRQELGPLAGSGTSVSARGELVWWGEGLPDESWAHSRDSVTSETSLSKASCGRNLNGNCWQGPWECWRAGSLQYRADRGRCQ